MGEELATKLFGITTATAATQNKCANCCSSRR